jgi:hypothetical protein
MVWELENGLKLIRALRDECRGYGYHLCLGGSVLNYGESDKDIDLYFLPFNNPNYQEDSEGLVLWLEKLWGRPSNIGDYSKPKINFKNWLDELTPAQVRFVRVENPDGTFDVVQEPIGINEDNPYPAPPKKPKKEQKVWEGPTVYKRKLKFVRPDGNRIDVFIL